MKPRKALIVSFSLLSACSLGSLAIAHAQNQPMTPDPSASPSGAMPGMAAGSGVEPTIYAATLNSLNSNVNGQDVTGTAQVAVDGDHIGISLNADGLFPGPHMAHIHKGTLCPDASDDANGDGVVDVIEGLPKYGGILINFDGDLSTFDGGKSYIPNADSNGSLTYIGGGNYTSLLQDLHRAAPDPKTGVVTLKAGEGLNLQVAHIVVHGIDPNFKLPSTAQTITGATSNQSLPVACGNLVLVRGPEITNAGGTSAGTASPSPTMSASPAASPSVSH